MKTLQKKLLLVLLILPFSILAQNTLKGKVLDSQNQPLPGVSILVKGTTNGVASDFDGNFVLSNLKKGNVVVFSSLGLKTQEFVYNDQKEVTIKMQDDAAQLDDIVLIGYGSVKKKDATGAVSVLSAKEFNKGSVVTAENLLNGRVAGVTVNTSGSPGSGSQIRIRGGSSLFASNDPLIVIDGLPITNETNTGSTSILAALNPNDIESFTVLKDASATAIYGSRASNGVIIITTKKGGEKLSVDYNFQYGSGKLVDKINVFSAAEFRNIITQKRPQDLGLLGTANTDWQDAIYRRTDFVDNNVSVKGNLFKAIPTRLSFGNTYQEGLRLTNNWNRNTVSLSMNPSFFDNHLKFRVSANYTGEKSRFADGVEGSAIRFDPTQPIYDSNSPFGGFFEYYNASNILLNGTRNPVAQLMQTNDTGKNNRLFGNFETEYKFHFLPELKAVVNLGYDEANGERTKNVGTNAATGFINADIRYGTDEYTERTLTSKLFDGYLNYNKTFGDLQLDATTGYSYQRFEDRKFETGNVRNPNLAENFPETTIETDNVIIGFFGRANFNYKNKYLITLSYRRDGSSRFNEENRWGNFPAVAFAWKLNEDFFKDSKTISDLKLRLGYGITGQQNLGNDAKNYYLQQYVTGSGTSQYTFGNTSTPIAVSTAYNELLKWETTTTYNLGLDYGLLNDRITGTLELFYKNSEDLLAKVAFADGGNFSNRGYQNIGNFTTKGIELAINAEIIKTDNFSWNVNFNTTKFERRIDQLAFNSDITLGDTGAGTGGTAQIHREGFTPFSFYVYKQLYDANGAAIEGAYADINGDNVVNEEDRYIYKNPDPDATFGFASNLNYKNFDFSFNLRASVGNRVYNAVDATRAQYNWLRDNAVLGNVPTSVLDTNFNTTDDVVLSDLYIENASFLRLDNVTLGYTFPKWLEGKASLRLFAGVQNAFVITKYSGLDPEITNDGRDNTIYPRQRSLLFGANIKF